MGDGPNLPAKAAFSADAGKGLAAAATDKKEV
jgi:hypothetical protein